MNKRRLGAVLCTVTGPSDVHCVLVRRKKGKARRPFEDDMAVVGHDEESESHAVAATGRRIGSEEHGFAKTAALASFCPACWHCWSCVRRKPYGLSVLYSSGDAERGGGLD